MHYLITGATGFIGLHLAKWLTDRGNSVRAFVRRTSSVGELERLGVTFAYGDILTGDGLVAAVEDVDCIIHMAGMTSTQQVPADAFFKCNAEGTRQLAHAASQARRPPRLVYVSSLAAAGPSRLGRPRVESDDPAPVSVYGRSKLAGELAVREFSDRVPSVIVRPPIVYGPMDRELLPLSLPWLRRGVMVKTGFGRKELSVIHVEDLCQGLLLAAQAATTLGAGDRTQGVYFLSDGQIHSWEEVCGAISEAIGRAPPKVISVPNALGYAAGLGAELGGRLFGVGRAFNLDKAKEASQEAWTCGIDRARTELGFKPAYPIDLGMKHAVAWFVRQGLA